GDGHVGLAGPHRFGERRGVTGGLGEVGVEEQQVARLVAAVVEEPDGFGAGLHCGALAAVAAVPDDLRPGLAGYLAGAVGRAVVDHHDQVGAGEFVRGLDGGRDAVGFVLGRDDHRYVLHIGDRSRAGPALGGGRRERPPPFSGPSRTRRGPVTPARTRGDAAPPPAGYGKAAAAGRARCAACRSRRSGRSGRSGGSGQRASMAGAASVTVNTVSRPVTWRMRFTAGRGAASSSEPPCSLSRFMAARSTFMPVESQNSTPLRSTTMRSTFSRRRPARAACSLGAVYRSSSPTAVTTV